MRCRRRVEAAIAGRRHGLELAAPPIVVVVVMLLLLVVVLLLLLLLVVVVRRGSARRARGRHRPGTELAATPVRVARLDGRRRPRRTRRWTRVARVAAFAERPLGRLLLVLLVAAALAVRRRLVRGAHHLDNAVFDVVERGQAHVLLLLLLLRRPQVGDAVSRRTGRHGGSPLGGPRLTGRRDGLHVRALLLLLRVPDETTLLLLGLQRLT